MIIWKDCPTCGGTGDPSENTLYFPCPTCEAHFAAVEEAVKRERRACAVIVDGQDDDCGHAANGLNAAAAAIRARGGKE